MTEGDIRAPSDHMVSHGQSQGKACHAGGTGGDTALQCTLPCVLEGLQSSPCYQSAAAGQSVALMGSRRELRGASLLSGVV